MLASGEKETYQSKIGRNIFANPKACEREMEKDPS